MGIINFNTTYIIQQQREADRLPTTDLAYCNKKCAERASYKFNEEVLCKKHYKQQIRSNLQKLKEVK